jgi:DNA-binding CsgD family transcriptional regulator/PAS domain-containing protein
MATAGEISAAVSSIYEAAIEFERWPRALLHISDLLGGTMAALVKGNRATDSVSTLAVRSYAGAREEYASYYHAHNIAWQHMAHLPPGASVVDWELFPREAVRRNACYGEFLTRLDVHSLLTTILIKDRSFSAVATFGRSQRAGEWDYEHREIMRLLAPHLRLAADVSQRLGGLGRFPTESAINVLQDGVIVLDETSRVVFANRAADELFAAADGLLVRHSKLCASFPSDMVLLQAAIAAVTAGHDYGRSGHTLVLQRPSSKRALTVVVAPLKAESAWFLAHSPAVILFVSDPERSWSVPLPDQLQALFGLTPMEALVGAEIFRGEGLRSAADALGISVTTARTHLQRIFGKTGTRKQAELVAIIARACPNLRS